MLVDTGAGNKETSKFHDIYGIENAGANGRTLLEDGLAQIGVRPEDVALVIDTHLHFDHAGGNTFVDGGGVVQLSFPNARYVVQRGEWEYATHTNERTAASYFPHNFAPIAAADRFDFVDGEREIVYGIRVIPTPGHTPLHQSVSDRGRRRDGVLSGRPGADVASLPLPWIMGYDVEPLVTLETKRAMLGKAAREGWLVIFEHDAKVVSGRVVLDGKAYALQP